MLPQPGQRKRPHPAFLHDGEDSGNRGVGHQGDASVPTPYAVKEQ